MNGRTENSGAKNTSQVDSIFPTNVQIVSHNVPDNAWEKYIRINNQYFLNLLQS